MLKTRQILALVLVTVFLAVSVTTVTAVPSSEVIPLSPQFSFTGVTANFYSSDYNLNYELADGKKLDLSYIAGLTAEKTHATINLAGGATVIESDTAFTDIISSTFLNNTFNAFTSSDGGTVASTEMATGSKSTVATGVAVTNGTGHSGYWKSDFWYDYNDDGDFADASDKDHYPSVDATCTLFINAKPLWNATDATAYMEVAVVFDTTGTDYTVRIRYWQTSGDTAWTDLDSSGENAATLNLYDTNNTNVAIPINMPDLLDSDLGDSPDIQGADYSHYRVFGGAATQCTVTGNNIAVLSDYPAFSDRTDDDKDFDFDSATPFSTFIWDDTDFICTKITEGATESYDNTLPLLNDVTNGQATLVQFRKLQITGVFSMQPTTWDIGTTLSGSDYLAMLDMDFLTTGLDSFDTASNYFSWTACQFNVTLDEDYLKGTYQDFEDQLVSFVIDGLEKKPAFYSAWDVAADETTVQYDVADPSSTSGSQQDITLKYYAQSYIDDSGGSGAASTGDLTALVQAILLVGIIIVLVVLAIFILTKRGKKKGKNKKGWMW